MGLVGNVNKAALSFSSKATARLVQAFLKHFKPRPVLRQGAGTCLWRIGYLAVSINGGGLFFVGVLKEKPYYWGPHSKQKSTLRKQLDTNSKTTPNLPTNVEPKPTLHQP